MKKGLDALLVRHKANLDFPFPSHLLTSSLPCIILRPNHWQYTKTDRPGSIGVELETIDSFLIKVAQVKKWREI